MKEYNIGDKVYIKDWGKHYRSTEWFNWKTIIPTYTSIDFNYEFIYEDNLTLRGTINKREPKKLKEKIPTYKNYEYVIIETILHPKNGKNICLCKFEEKCYIAVDIEALCSLTPEEQIKVKHLEKENYLQALAFDNLNKWTIDSNIKEFPKELLKYLYDRNQTTQFGAIYTEAIIKYPYIAKEYTINGNDICLGWEQLYNGVGCNLTDKETISWSELPKRFPENKFQ
jgi:hypothetical protein